MTKPNLKVTDWFPASTAPALQGYYEVSFDGETVSRYQRYWNGSAWLLDGQDSCLSLAMEKDNARWRGVRMWVLVRNSLADEVPVYCIDPVAELPGWSRLATDATPYKTRAAAHRAAARNRALDLRAVLA